MTDLLEEMIRDASKRAEKCFKKHGSIATQYFALCSDGEFIGFEAGFSNAAERDYSRMMVRALFAERNVQRYVHVAECWTTTKESKVAPKDDPNRQEGILFIAEDRILGLAQALRFIDRSSKRPKLNPLEKIDRLKVLSGRLASMFTALGDRAEMN